MHWITAIYGVTIASIVAQTLACVWHLQWVKRLPPSLSIDKPKTPPKCSVVIAARDEEARIEKTVRRLLSQNGVDLEVIVADDRSTDRTSEILKRISDEDRRLRVQRIDKLPDGWLGKCHGCHVGAGVATGDWILFTDADCWLQPDVVARAIAIAEKEGAAHITLLPGTPLQNIGTRAWHLMFLATILSWISGVNRDRRGAHLGLGAFNLVRAPLYRKSGGYEALRMTVLDDMRLGLLVRRAGEKTRAYLGSGDVECHWGTTIRAMIKVMEKNYFAALNFRTEVAMAALLFSGVAFGIIASGLLSGTVLGVTAGLSPLLGIVPAAILARRSNWPWTSALLTPFMFPVMMYALLRSTVVTLRNGGVRWRETFYPLQQLRADMVR